MTPICGESTASIDTNLRLTEGEHPPTMTSHGAGGADLPPGMGEGDVAGKTTLGVLVERYLTQRIRSGTLAIDSGRNHRSALHRLAAIHGQRSAGQLGRATLLAWLETRGRLRPASRRAQVSYVRSFLAWLTAEGIVRKDPSVFLPKVKPPRSNPRAMDADAVEKVRVTCPDARGRAIVSLMFELGLRCVEVSRLNVEDWSRRDQMIRVVGKGGHSRDLPVPDVVTRAIGAYLDEHPATSGPLIRSYRDTTALGRDTISGMVSEWMRFAGVKHAPRDGVSAHALRHTAASDLLDACGDLRVVQEFLGHEHLATTSIYLRRAGTAKMRDAMDARHKEAS